MKAFLMHRNRDFVLKESLPPHTADLARDLDLETLLHAMSGGDQFLFDVAKQALLASLHEPEAILYRQNILADCMEWPEMIREIYGIAVEAIKRANDVWGWMALKYPSGALHWSLEVLQSFLNLLKRLRQIADEHLTNVRSEGFRRLFDMLARELDDEYLGLVENHLRRLAFHSGMLISAGLGKGNKGVNYVLHKTPKTKQSWIERFQAWLDQVGSDNHSSYLYEIADRDETGFRALSDLKDHGISKVAVALAQSTDHILSFFSMLRLELGFYVGCLNLRNRLTSKNLTVCMPKPLAVCEVMFSARGLYDACLSLNMNERIIGNDVAGDGKLLMMITGANQGGKSTFLRSAGLAQLMMQCGMFAPAEYFRANVCDGIFTHFKREEDATMKSGKLDEELGRMSSILDWMPPNSVVLLNESFASTNEREGSEIARQIVRALLENGIKVLYVTHMFDLAQGFNVEKTASALFLRAERLSDGRRTFRLIEGEPLSTSYGEDLYWRIFNANGSEAMETLD
jgi:DNA mismatch repair ATPase MutS